MRQLCALIVLVCLPGTALAQRGSADDAGIRKAIEDHYFKAQATGSGEHLKGTFVDEGRMMWVQDGQRACGRARTTSAASPASPRLTRRSGNAACS
jgi:hypothetical protein